MPFIRLSDNYIDNPKFTALSDGAFRLWHEGMAFTRRHQTDGIIPFATMKGFPSFTKSREKQLAAPYVEGANPLWVLIPGTGYRIHDYLAWNLSREEEQSERTATAARVRKFREGKRNGVTEGVTSTVTNGVRNANVLDTDRTGQGSQPPEKKRGWSVLDGSLPRDHLRHAECGRVCLHQQQFARFVAKLGGDRAVAEKAVSAWARGVLVIWEEGAMCDTPIGGNDFQFWDARWSEWQGGASVTRDEDAEYQALIRKGPSVRP